MQKVLGIGSYNFLIPQWISTSCFFQLSQGSKHFISKTFPIMAKNGSAMAWGATTDAPLVRSQTDFLVHKSDSSMQSTGTPIPAIRRPPINLTSDGPDSQYVLDDGTDCLNNADQYTPECWRVLNITSWLPQWFLQTPQCKQGQNQAFCNIVLPKPEPWTQTFLREADGGPGPDCTIIPNACPNSFDADVGSGDSRLERARYKYVRYNIISESLPCMESPILGG